MFSAFIVVCMIDGICLSFEDQYGPYDTIEECSVRTEEMASIVNLFPFYLPWRIVEMDCRETEIGETA